MWKEYSSLWMNKSRAKEKVELRNELRGERAQAVDTISKYVAATVQEAVQTIRETMAQINKEFSQRIYVLEMD